jgi:ATP synthase protein I
LLTKPEDPVTRKAYRIVGLQVLVTVLIALPLLAFSGALAAGSSLAGGAIGFLTSLAYIRRMAAPSAGRDPRILLRNHALAECLKLGLTVVLFAAVFIFFKEVAVLPLLLTFMATLAMYWVALLVVF